MKIANVQPVKVSELNHDIKFRENIFKTKPYENDKVELSIKKAQENRPVSFGEGLKIVGKGFIGKVKDIASSIVKHPIRTLLTAGATTLALSALPLIGVTTATGACVLALGAAGIAVGKTAVHTAKAIKHAKNNENDELRKDLSKIGGDCLDLALSLPFAPKALKQVKRAAKFGPKVAFDKELWTNFKNAKGVGAKRLELLKGECKINFDTIASEMGIKVKPKLVFDDSMMFSAESIMAGEFEPCSGTLKINPKVLNPAVQKLAKTNIEELIKHELTHYQQFSDIARANGAQGLKQTLTDYYKIVSDKNIVLPKDNQICSDNLLKGDGSLFNEKFYNDIIKAEGKIMPNTPEALKSQNYVDGWIAKVTTQIDEINNLGLAYTPKKMLEIYRKNVLEKEAFANQEIFKKDVITMRPGAIISNLEVQSLLNDKEV